MDLEMLTEATKTEATKNVKENILPQTIADVWPEIQKFLPTGEPADFNTMVRDYPERLGKYVRPALVLTSCETFGGDRSKAIQTAAAMQTSEEWLLMRDDWQDGSVERRGKLCAHRLYGDFKASNATDALHVVMWNILNKNDEVVGYEKGRRIRDLFVEMLMRTVRGQHRELTWTESGKLDLTPEEWYEVADAKAGVYTAIGPMQLGAVVASTYDYLDALKEIGIPLGRAFQLRDDVLNIIGDKAKYGKKIGGDILEGKRTVLLGHLYRNCSGDEREALDEFFSKPRDKREEATEVEHTVEHIMSLMKKYGSVDFAQSIAEENAKLALELFINRLSDVPETKAKSELRDLVIFMTYRDH